MQDTQLILASGSPRRRELLSRVGLTFTVQPADVDETLVPGLSPGAQVLRLSRLKAEAARAPGDAVVLAADTIVVLDGTILGKPATEQEARRMLGALSGRSHLVLTGVTVRRGDRIEQQCEETEVHFRALSDREINAYIATGEPLDKAGAYGIQGYASLFVEKLVGDYFNVVGLPLCTVGLMLRRAGIPLLEDIP